MEYNGRQRQSIHAAHDGRHSTLRGDYVVSHAGTRTFCLPASTSTDSLIPAEKTGFGHPGDRAFQTLTERENAAMDNFAPRAPEVVWRNGVGIPREMARAMVAAARDAGLEVPADLSAAKL